MAENTGFSFPRTVSPTKLLEAQDQNADSPGGEWTLKAHGGSRIPRPAASTPVGQRIASKVRDLKGAFCGSPQSNSCRCLPSTPPHLHLLDWSFPFLHPPCLHSRGPALHCPPPTFWAWVRAAARMP